VECVECDIPFFWSVVVGVVVVLGKIEIDEGAGAFGAAGAILELWGSACAARCTQLVWSELLYDMKD